MPKHDYHLRFTPKAAEDLDEIYEYVFNTLSAGLAADNLISKIEKAVMRLKEYPFSCQRVLDEPLKAKGYRKLIVDNYMVFYLVNEVEEEIVLVRVLYGASKYQDIL